MTAKKEDGTMPENGAVTEQNIKELTSIVGLHNIITTENEMDAYSYDENPDGERYFPGAVVKPEDGETVGRVLAYAAENGIPVIPRGAGTGLNGGCVAMYGGIVLSLERMNKILDINRENFTAVVEPGVTLADLIARVEEQGLYYPLYPGEMSATIGGTIATNAGGMNAVKYGVTRNNVLGLEAALASGEIIKTGGEFVKCSSGYDLTQLIIGSEGTLAVVTKIILKLTTKPARREVLFAPFSSLQSAIDAVPEILSLRMTPIGIEFMEQDIFRIVEAYTGEQIPYRENAYLMIIMEGDTEDEILDYFGSVEEICARLGSKEAMVAGSETDRRALLELREGFYHSIKRQGPLELIDIVVPRSSIARFVKKVKEISEEYGIDVIAYGHAGDGNVHLHPICRDMDRGEWDRKLPDLMKEIYKAGVSFGGAISGEHGIGAGKKAYLPVQLDEPLMNTMRAIKKAFDPANILNPGKIFDL